jgi:FKBP-type peptidyl-prolyl cis-trans isomerase
MTRNQSRRATILGVTLACAACDAGEHVAPAAGKVAAAPAFDAPHGTQSQDLPRSDVPPPADLLQPPATAERGVSGLASVVLKPGTGTEHPRLWDEVQVHYTGWTSDGKMFDNTRRRATPGKFSLHQVIDGWGEGVQKMVVGESRRLWVPAKLAYAERPDGPQGDLVFDIELLAVRQRPEPPPTPADVAAAPKNAKRTASGLAYVVLERGDGKKLASEEDAVVVEFAGWLASGKFFDASVLEGQPLRVQPKRLFPGWKEAILLMHQGDRLRVWIPANLAFAGRPGAPQGDLVYELALKEIAEAPKPPEVPKDVAAPPASAKKTASGLAYQVLKPGTGTTHPAPTSRVRVHYSGWTTDGKMFDSSVPRGQPSSFALNAVVPGWTEGVQLMVEGERTRFWIPESLAYGGKPGKPAGMLVFDVELIAIEGG